MIDTHADWLAREPFTLVLSAGFFGFFAHTGVVQALEQAGLRAGRVVGVSAGAIVGGCWASGVPGATLAGVLQGLRRENFWDPSWDPAGWSLLSRPPDPGTPLGLLRGRKLDRLLAAVLAPTGVERIEDCPIRFSPVTHDLLASRPIAHERGPLRPAIRASAALPGMFGPVRVQGRLHADGGIRDRPGFSALAPEERALYHHLIRRRGKRGPLRAATLAREAEELRVLPSRPVLVIPELPKVGPNSLDRGREAMRVAKVATLRWLDQRFVVPG